MLTTYELWHWRTDPLLVPSYYTNRNIAARTAWTAEGLALSSSQAYKDGALSAKPGIHFVAVEPLDGTFFSFPEKPDDIYKAFSHFWILIRKTIPDVVVIEDLKLPSPSRTATYNAQY